VRDVFHFSTFPPEEWKTCLLEEMFSTFPLFYTTERVEKKKESGKHLFFHSGAKVEMWKVENMSFGRDLGISEQF
jgi:hypothetical protein